MPVPRFYERLLRRLPMEVGLAASHTAQAGLIQYRAELMADVIGITG
jgi:hypothetical protein